MTNTQTHLKDGIEVMFNNLLMAADEFITLPTAAQLAKELGINDYSPLDFDH